MFRQAANRKRVYQIVVIAALGVAYAAPGDAAVSTWKNNKTAALTFTIDDGILGPTEKFQKAFADNKIKGTFGINNFQQYWTVPWSTIKQLATEGHEISNHSASHVSITSANYPTEVSTFNNTLQTQSGIKPITFIYPMGTVNADVKTLLASSGFISARGVTNAYEAKSPLDWFNLRTKIVATGQTASTWNSWADQVLSNGGWCIELWHNVDNAGQWANVSAAEMGSHVGYVAGKNNLWIETMSGVSKYIKQRDAAIISVTKKSADEYAFSVADNLDNTVYNVPITVRIEVAGWSFASATQSGNSLEASVATIGGIQYALVNAIPDAGTITVQKSTSNSGGGTNTSSSSLSTSSSSSSLSTNVAPFDNFEDGDNANNYGGYWYAFTDAENGGQSTVAFNVEGGGYKSANAGAATFTFTKGTYVYNGFIGIGVNWVAEEGTSIDVSTTTGITFSYKGSATRFLFQSSDVTDFDYFGYDLPAVADWTTVTLNWSDFTQGGWGSAKLSIALNKAVSLAWQATGADGTSGTLAIDNVSILGAVGIAPLPLVQPKWKQVSKSFYLSRHKGGSLQVHSSYPLDRLMIHNAKGHLIHDITLDGSPSQTIQIPRSDFGLGQGMYIISAPGYRPRGVMVY